MSDTRIWLIVLGLTLVSIVTRSFFLLLGARVSLSQGLQRALRYAPVGALVAIVVPEILVAKGNDGGFVFSLSNPQLWGGLAATVGMVWSRSMLVTLLVGMVVFSAVRMVF
jgi:branched-subunit amino acid transport protein